MAQQVQKGVTEGMAGFTLVEKLLVVAIIMVLVGIILAALGPAREKGRQAVCLSNFRQLHAAILMYQRDYGGAELGRYFEMGLPPNKIVLARYMGWKPPEDLSKAPPPAYMKCPDDRDKKALLSYFYTVCDNEGTPPGAPFVRRCTLGGGVVGPDWIDVVLERGDETPILIDFHHDFRPPALGRQPQFVLLLRLGGQTKAYPVVKGSNYWNW